MKEVNVLLKDAKEQKMPKHIAAFFNQKSECDNNCVHRVRKQMEDEMKRLERLSPDDPFLDKKRNFIQQRFQPIESQCEQLCGKKFSNVIAGG